MQDSWFNDMIERSQIIAEIMYFENPSQLHESYRVRHGENSKHPLMCPLIRAAGDDVGIGR